MGLEVCRCSPRDIDDWTRSSPHRYTLWEEFKRGGGKYCPRCEAPSLRPDSTDIRAAMDVFAYLCKGSTGCNFGVERTVVPFLINEWKAWVNFDDLPGEDGAVVAQGDSAPHAIVLAALKAVEK